MKFERKKVRDILLICFYILVTLIMIFLVFFNKKEEYREELYSISARGYSFNNEFSPDIYEYDLVITNNSVDISCDANADIEGCNVTLDLTGKDKYSHIIRVYSGSETYEYVINIKNETVIEDKVFYIKEVKGNTFEWTSNDITLEVIMAGNSIYVYSFDGGVTWQESNLFTVSSNGIYPVVAMDVDKNLTNIVNVQVDRIDKEKPQVTINKLKLNDSKVTLEVVAYDSLSGVDSISFNGKEFSNETKYEVSSAGNYYVLVKDKVGNLTDKVYIEVTADELKKKNNNNDSNDKGKDEPKVEVKTYTLTLNGNGSNVEKKQVSCSTTGSSCQVILPKIITSSTVVGWAKNSNATTADYLVGATIELNGNMTLYAITKREYTAVFKQNGASSIGSVSLSCTAYNSAKCSITTPTISSNGSVIGWGSSASATKASYGVNQTIELNGNIVLYAITKKQYTATFNKNGASSIGSANLTCTAYNSNKCVVTMPSITTTGSVIGWGDNSSSTSARYSVNQKVELNSNITLYAVTKKTFTATFSNQGLSYLSASSLSCSVYNTGSSCNITLPYFNKPGHFNSFWSEKSEVSSNLSGKTWTWNYFKQAGKTYELTRNVTLYPNFNQFHYDLVKNCYKYRSISVSTTRFIGNTMFEFENGIPATAINNFMNSMNTAYNIMPWLFTPGKVFIMTESTYSNYSTAYGLTHQMYQPYGGDSYFTIDLKYDASGAVVKNAIDINAALHELGHAWDSYYKYRTGSGRICDTGDFNNFYNSISSKLYTDSSGNKISKVETFAGMVTNYYWHVLGADRSKSHYALKSNVTLNSAELTSLKTFMEKYIAISKNGY